MFVAVNSREGPKYMAWGRHQFRKELIVVVMDTIREKLRRILVNQRFAELSGSTACRVCSMRPREGGY